MGKVEQIVDIHYKGLTEEFKTIGIDVKIDKEFLRQKWAEYGGHVEIFYNDDRRVIGFATDGVEPMVYVDPECQRKGVGSVLLKAANTKVAWVINGNTKAENFYKKNGFKPTVSRETTKLGHEITETKWVNEVS